MELEARHFEGVEIQVSHDARCLWVLLATLHALVKLLVAFAIADCEDVVIEVPIIL